MAFCRDEIDPMFNHLGGGADFIDTSGGIETALGICIHDGGSPIIFSQMPVGDVHQSCTDLQGSTGWCFCPYASPSTPPALPPPPLPPPPSAPPAAPLGDPQPVSYTHLTLPTKA